MQIGYMPVSKADGSQSTDLQRDALRAAGLLRDDSTRKRLRDGVLRKDGQKVAEGGQVRNRNKKKR